MKQRERFSITASLSFGLAFLLFSCGIQPSFISQLKKEYENKSTERGDLIVSISFADQNQFKGFKKIRFINEKSESDRRNNYSNKIKESKYYIDFNCEGRFGEKRDNVTFDELESGISFANIPTGGCSIFIDARSKRDENEITWAKGRKSFDVILGFNGITVDVYEIASDTDAFTAEEKVDSRQTDGFDIVTAEQEINNPVLVVEEVVEIGKVETNSDSDVIGEPSEVDGFVKGSEEELGNADSIEGCENPAEVATEEVKYDNIERDESEPSEEVEYPTEEPTYPDKRDGLTHPIINTLEQPVEESQRNSLTVGFLLHTPPSITSVEYNERPDSFFTLDAEIYDLDGDLSSVILVGYSSISLQLIETIDGHTKVSANEEISVLEAGRETVTLRATDATGLFTDFAITLTLDSSLILANPRDSNSIVNRSSNNNIGILPMKR